MDTQVPRTRLSITQTTGSQGQGKQALGEQKPAKGYYDGIKQGRKKVIDEINNRLTKGDIRLVIESPNKRKEQHLAKLIEILGVDYGKTDG